MQKGKFWEGKDRKKAFLDDYARQKGFDPLIPDNWYNITYADIIAQKVHVYVCINTISWMPSCLTYVLRKITLK